mmetsp:Transcript_24989/g.58977  ORF Transcript_24989/g.58977 Transcript_24989/m.58977 type:complete len:640 (-) Transcript_24989:234-2153(-)|eukprot:CAMPEP_0172391118 /NCGR_PEP_ID=MMETSP1061-20121228/7590_1 /TAXON_ID=37318 /ORGANISM="Pseudo-nitzschia pungens, Strain cf. pungens" /LENGTH=639 /DNA_ID=CAMNT_0013121651 /DNA_START=96 /DNA_END=2015 /DNA_ORIENTATION=+
MPISAPPPGRPPPPRRPPQPSSPRITTPRLGSRTVGDGNTDGTKGFGIAPQHKMDAPSTPVHNAHRDSTAHLGSPVSASSSTLVQSSPLREAAHLIQSLDIARTRMMGSAADAATEAETARRNARTAQEIARRYQTQSYPVFRVDSLEASMSSVATIATATTTASTSFVIASRPKHPDIQGLKKKNTVDDGKDADGEEKSFQQEDESPSQKQSNKDGAGEIIHKVPRSPTRPYRSPSRNPPGTGDFISPILKLQGAGDKSSNTSTHNRGEFQSPTSLERIAQQHADDLLQLTMELERTKQELKSEQRLRKQCQSSLASMQSKASNLERINKKLLEDAQSGRKQSTTEVSDLRNELKSTTMKLQAAEEDAQLALDLAKDSAEEKDKLEELLRKTQEEVEMLKKRVGNNRLAVVTTPERRVHFADTEVIDSVDSNKAATSGTPVEEKSPIAFDSPREGGPSRAMIAAGRQLLLRRNMSPQEAVIRLELTPSKSAERRQQLAERLNKSLNESNAGDTNIMLLSSSPSRTPFSPTPGSKAALHSGDSHSALHSITNIDMKSTLGEYNAAVKTLETSGKRLDLDGYFWREHSKTKPSSHTPIRIDQMTRQYCQNVEFKIDRQQKDINQLESLLGFLEKKLVLDE